MYEIQSLKKLLMNTGLLFLLLIFLAIILALIKVMYNNDTIIIIYLPKFLCFYCLVFMLSIFFY